MLIPMMLTAIWVRGRKRASLAQSCQLTKNPVAGSVYCVVVNCALGGAGGVPGVKQAMTNDRVADTALIRTKLAPPVNPGWTLVQRDALERICASESTGGIDIVTAPAGYGKTCLLYQIYDRRRAGGHVCGWVSLDRYDVAPARFLRHVIAALNTQAVVINTKTLKLLDTAKSLEDHRVIDQIISDILAYGARCVLFLDDFHFADNPVITAAINHLVDYKPDNLRLVIASRKMPDLALSRFRLQGKLHEIGVEALQFSQQETDSLFQHLRADTLSVQAKDLIRDRSEGWVAGMILASNVLQTHRYGQNAQDTLNGNLRDIADYLAQTVFEAQSPDVQDFLTRTSIFDRFNADTCRQLTGYPRAQEMIEFLERHNLFIVPLDSTRHWYRYHHLFQSFLQGMLEKRHGAELPDLYACAAHVMQQQGLDVEALTCALLAGVPDMAADMAARHSWGQILRGYVPEQIEWLRTLSTDLLDRNLRLRSALVFCLWHSYQQASATLELETFEAVLASQRGNLKATDYAHFKNEIALHRAGISVCSSDNPQKVLALTEYVDTDQLSDFLHAVFHNIRGIALSELNHFSKSLTCFRQAYELHSRAESPLGVTICYYLEAMVHYEKGDLNALEGLLARVADDRTLKIPSAQYLYPTMIECMEGALLCERGQDVARAGQILGNNVDLANAIGHMKMACVVSIAYARLLFTMGKSDSALAILQDLHEQLRRNTQTYSRATILVDYEILRYAIRAKNYFAAQEIAEKYDIDLTAPPPDLQDSWERLNSLTALIWVRHQISIGTAERTIDTLHKLAGNASNQGRKRRYIEIQLLLAVAHATQGDRDVAKDLVKSALMTAYQDGMARVFLDEYALIAPLIAELVADGALILISADFLSILSLVGGQPGSPATLLSPPEGGHALTKAPALSAADFSDKEYKIMIMMAEGCSNKQISDNVHVSTHTVKWHLQNIFAKLGVPNRVAAATAAKSLGLI